MVGSSLKKDNLSSTHPPHRPSTLAAILFIYWPGLALALNLPEVNQVTGNCFRMVRIVLKITFWGLRYPKGMTGSVPLCPIMALVKSPLSTLMQRGRLLSFWNRAFINVARPEKRVIGNLRTTTKFTTTTSVDWEKTGTRTSVSAAKRKLKMLSVGKSTTTTLNLNTNVELWVVILSLPQDCRNVKDYFLTKVNVY